MHKILLTTALVLPLGAGLALAQTDTTTTDMTTTTDTTMPAETTAPDTAITTTETTITDTEVVPSDTLVQTQAANELRVDWIIDATVTSPSGESIGDVNDLLLDGDTGEMKAAIVGVGGFLGIGEKQIAIDWSRLNVNFDANQITTDMTREEAEAAPAFEFRERAAPADATAGDVVTTDDMATDGVTTDEAVTPIDEVTPLDATTTPPHPTLAPNATDPAAGDMTGTDTEPAPDAN